MNSRFVRTICFLTILSVFAAAFFASADAAAPGTTSDDVVIWKSSDYQIYMNFTGPRGVRYLAGLGDGPYAKGDLFVWQSGAYSFSRYVRESGSTNAEDRVRVTFSSITNSRLIKSATLSRFCDPDSSGNSSVGDCHISTVPTCSCNMDSVKFRLIALEDAMNDVDPTQYMNDRIVEVDAADLFWGMSGNSVVYFDAATNQVFFATDEQDRTLTMDPSTIGHAGIFKSPSVEMFVVREADLYSDVDSTIFNASMDLNNEVLRANGSPDDDDLLLVFASGGKKKEYAVIDFSDRNYNTANTWMHSNGMGIYSSFSSDPTANYASSVAEAAATSNNWTSLQSQLNSNTYFLYWGPDQRLDGVGIRFGYKATK